MSELSPAARSVFESFNSKFDWIEDGVPGPQFKAIAAALRAAADQVVPEFWHEEGDIYAETKHDVRADLLAIAAELEGAGAGSVQRLHRP